MHAKQLCMLINPFPEATRISFGELRPRSSIHFSLETQRILTCHEVFSVQFYPSTHTYTYNWCCLTYKEKYVIYNDCVFLYCPIGDLAFLFCHVGGNPAWLSLTHYLSLYHPVGCPVWHKLHVRIDDIICGSNSKWKWRGSFFKIIKNFKTETVEH